LAAWGLAVLCDDDFVDDLVDESPAILDDAIGAEAPVEELVWANAPKLTAEAMTAAMRVFMRILVGCDGAESSPSQRRPAEAG
jgi:hypothetical protein